MKKYEPNLQVAMGFMADLYTRIYEYDVMVYPEEGGPQQFYRTHKDYIEKMVDRNSRGINVVIGVGNEWNDLEATYCCSPFQNADIAMAECTNIPYLCVGVSYRDKIGGATNEKREKAIRLVEALYLRPTAVVDTGVSLQLYWAFKENDQSFFCDPDLQGEEESAYQEAMWICGMADALYRLVLDEASKMGLGLETLSVAIEPSKRFGRMGVYTLLPGFVNHVCDALSGLAEQYMVEVIEFNTSFYTFEDIERWMDERIPGTPEKTMTYTEAVDALMEGRILYFALQRSFPETEHLEYRREGSTVLVNNGARNDLTTTD